MIDFKEFMGILNNKISISIIICYKAKVLKVEEIDWSDADDIENTMYFINDICVVLYKNPVVTAITDNFISKDLEISTKSLGVEFYFQKFIKIHDCHIEVLDSDEIRYIR